MSAYDPKRTSAADADEIFAFNPFSIGRTSVVGQCFLQLSKIFVLSFYCLNEQLSDGMTSQLSWDYDRTEILADGFVHILGVAMAIAGAAVLINIAAHADNVLRLAAIVIYLAGLLALFCFSAVYNLWPVSPVKWWLRRLDHSAIYLLIAATYTAFMLPIYGSAATAGVLAAVWSAALAGMAIKLLWPGRFDRTSIAVYLTMGWSGVFKIESIAAALAPVTLLLIAAGGILYSVGVVFHGWRHLRFQNAIWHGFVLAAATCHYAAVLTSLAK